MKEIKSVTLSGGYSLAVVWTVGRTLHAVPVPAVEKRRTEYPVSLLGGGFVTLELKRWGFMVRRL